VATLSRAAADGAADGLRDLRVGVEAAGRKAAAVLGPWWRDLPSLTQVFVILVVVDLLARAIGLAWPALPRDGSAMSLITAFFPRELLILLPGLVVARQPDAARTTPLILNGALLVSLTELLSPTGIAAAGFLGFGPWALASMATSVLTAAGWISLAAGIAALARAKPTSSIVGMANLVAGAIGIAAVVGLALAILSPARVGDPGIDALLVIVSVVAVAPAVAWAYLGRVAVQGVADARRPALATRLAAAAFGTFAALAGVDVIVGAAVVVGRAFGADLQIPLPALAFGSIGTWLCTSAFLVAFALGLADAEIPAIERTPSDDRPPVSWSTVRAWLAAPVAAPKDQPEVERVDLPEEPTGSA
jgi:hypothetical protein